jgi:CBS domain-containing protein
MIAEDPMKAADVMTREPIRITSQTTIVEAAQLMLQHRVSGLPVTDAAGAVVGIVTEGDLMRRAEIATDRHRSSWRAFLVGPGRLAGDYVGAHASKVGGVMTLDVAVVTPSDDLAAVVSLMERRHVKRVPVVDGGKLVGIVSRADLVRALVHGLMLEATASMPDRVTDEAIRARIVEIIDREPWGPRYSVNVVVNGGVVDLRGSIGDERERAALTVAAEGVAGVKAVIDHLVWVEPTSGLVVGADKAP